MKSLLIFFRTLSFFFLQLQGALLFSQPISFVGLKAHKLLKSSF
jgi:hypothetical protein